jgi:hypothetical protein
MEKEIIMSANNTEASTVNLTGSTFEPEIGAYISDKGTSLKARLILALEACLTAMNRVPFIVE